MNWSDRFIGSCSSWSSFWERAKKLTTDSEKGAVFERLTQLYLRTTPEYQTELRHVWTLGEVPAAVRRRLDLPSRDEGIDLVACTRHGQYWAVQSKFRSQRDKPLNRRELGTFTSLAFNTCSNIALAVVAHTASKPVSKRHLMRNTTEIGLDRWQSLDEAAWRLIVGRLRGRRARPDARRPRPHQLAAISAAKVHFIRDGAVRGRLIMPCGTGKSLTAYWIAEALKAKTILVAVPSLALVRQSLTDWTREFLAHGVKPDWLCVCSDESVGNLERDEFVGEVYDLGLPTHTDSDEIAALLRARSNGPKIIFTTYQSSDKLAAAARKASIHFDLAILDEAHKTVGVHSKKFATLLSDKQIKICRRLFMTATERVFRGDREDVLSMDSETAYGARFFQLSFKEAIKQRIITDYKILTMTVSDHQIRQLIHENRILNLTWRDLDEAEAQSVAAGIALKRIFKNREIKHAISFHRSIRGADRFREQQDALNGLREIGPKTANLHISSKRTAGERSDLLRKFIGHKRALMTNARCLTEGVDIPAIDCVLFADPKQSRIDIVQAAGRALRRYRGKRYGYIVVPLIVPTKMDFREFAKTTAFRQVAQTITALSTQDERIADEFRAIERGRISSGKIVEIDADIPAGMKMKLGDFVEAISTRVWDSVGRANWRKFEDARAFVRRLGLKSSDEWREYCKSDKKPADIPTGPQQVYADVGWVGYSDWLGTGRVPPGQYRAFNEARVLVRALGLKSATEWREYCRFGKKPVDIPTHPRKAYLEAGWTSWGDWLGTGRISDWSREHQPFKKAREFARSLNLKSETEWGSYCKSGKLPNDIPKAPAGVYAETGWAGMGDWLGTDRRRGSNFLPFKQARAFARLLNLKSHAEWVAHTTLGKLPNGTPRRPDRTYAGNGWAGWPDWFGIAAVQIRSFNKARIFARSLGLKSGTEWSNYCNSGKKPADIPAKPGRAYAHDGWAGMNDWLGTGKIAPGHYRSFKKARDYVRRRGLKSKTEWSSFCKSGKKPVDVPANPNSVYAHDGWVRWGDWWGLGPVEFAARVGDRSRRPVLSLATGASNSIAAWTDFCKSDKKPHDIPAGPSAVYENDGWAGWGDWLGTGRVARPEYRPFKKARAFARGLGLKSTTEWLSYCRSGKAPSDIPTHPERAYADDGWAGMGDWLGSGRVAPGGHRSFENARAYVRGLNLKSVAEWLDHRRSGKKPADIPVGASAVYTNDGWIGWGDWLGTGRVARGEYRPFKKARTFVHRLRLKSEDEWRRYLKSGKKPPDIPAGPRAIYANNGWVGWGDWLGTGRVAHGEQRSFKEARAFVRRLGLKSSNEWLDYRKSGKRPGNIPSNPYKTYAEAGWAGMGDWLGYARKR